MGDISVLLRLTGISMVGLSSVYGSFKDKPDMAIDNRNVVVGEKHEKRFT
jgi:hypothetical protein